MIAAHLTPARIWVSRSQQKIIRPALGWIRKHEELDDWTSALECCCAETIGYVRQPSWPLIVIPTEGSTQQFRFLRSSHPADKRDGAIDTANKTIGLDDEGAALTHIAATFILTRPEIADSPSRKMRALRTRLKADLLKAAAEQGGWTT